MRGFLHRRVDWTFVVSHRHVRFHHCPQMVTISTAACFSRRFLSLSKLSIPPKSVLIPTYQLSKHLTSILKPLTDKSRHKLQSTDNFIDAIKTIQIPDDHKLVSFDVKSLFTSIPLQLALDCTKTAINKSHYQPPLPTDDLMDLLRLCLTSNYFQ